VAVVEVPGSKSITARALFLAAAADGTTVLRKPLDSDDTAGFAEGLIALGYELDRAPGRWRVEGRPQGPALAQARVFCRDGATTSRFLPALAAAGHGEFHFDASSQMRRRPLGPLTKALRSVGVDLVHEIEEGHHPLIIRADGIKGGHVTLDAGLSSQFLTALLLLGPLTAEGLAITVTDLVSAPYAEITTAMMARFGVGVERDGDTYLVPARPYTATDYLVEPDASTASYFLAAAALAGRSITTPGLGSHSRQGDLRSPRSPTARSASRMSTTPGSRNATGSKPARRTSAPPAFRSRWAATGSRSTRPGPGRRTSPASATIASRWPSASPACAPLASPWTTRDASRRPAPDSTPRSPRSRPPGHTKSDVT